MKRCFLTILVALFAGLFPVSQSQADTVVEVGDNLANALPFGLNITEPIRDTFFPFQTGTQSGSDWVFTGLTATDSTNGVEFTFDITFAAVSGIDVGGLAANGTAINTSLGEANATGGVDTFEDGDTISVTISNVNVVTSGATAVFSGFVNFGTDNSGVGEGFNVDGIDYIRGTDTNGDDDPRQGIALPAGNNSTITDTPLLEQNSVDISFIGGSVSLRAVAFEFATTTATGAFDVGDVNCDGSIDFRDISPFIGILSAGTFEDKADIDRNGDVDFLDISPFIGLLSSP